MDKTHTAAGRSDLDGVTQHPPAHPAGTDLAVVETDNGHRLTIAQAVDNLRVAHTRAVRAIARGDAERGVIVPASTIVAVVECLLTARADADQAALDLVAIADHAERFRAMGITASRLGDRVRALVREWGGPGGLPALRPVTQRDIGYADAWTAVAAVLAAEVEAAMRPEPTVPGPT